MGSMLLHGVMDALGLVPFGVWIVLFIGLIGLVFILRYATNWKVDLFFLVGFLIISEGLTLRQHWIDLGRAKMAAEVAEAKSEVEAYKKTNKLIMDCYTHQGQLWDRTQGQCVRVDGAPAQ